MREFFRGWKRKLGVVTLVMACVLTAGWVRSQSLVDDYCTGNGTLPDRFRIRSCSDRITVISEHNKSNWNRPGGWGYRRLEVKDLVNSPTGYEFEIERHVFEYDAHLRFWGFEYGFLREAIQPSTRQFRATFCTIPYFSIVLPLTLLSAWLLLLKPRPAKRGSWGHSII